MARNGGSRLVYSTGGDVPERQQPAPRPPTTEARAGVRLRLDRRASGRLVTVVTGLPGTETEVAALLRELKSACGTGGSVKQGAVELQGDRREQVEAALAARGIRSKRAGG